MFLEISQDSQDKACAEVSFNFIKKETLSQVLSCEFCEISKNTIFTEHLRTTVSVSIYINKYICLIYMGLQFLAVDDWKKVIK